MLQVECKAKGIFDLSHEVSRELAELAFQPWFNQGPNPLHIDDRRRIEEWKTPNWNFIATATLLGGQGNVSKEGPWGIRIMTGHDEDRTGFGRQSQVSQPNLTRLSFHRAYGGLPVRQPGPGANRARQSRPVQ